MHFIVYIETNDIYEDIEEDVETGCDASNMNQICRKSKKVTGLMKDGLDENIMTKSVELRAKTYIYLLDR